MSDTELKPCPFCGGKAEKHNDLTSFMVYCLSCGASVKPESEYWTEQEVVDAWNRRVTDDKKEKKMANAEFYWNEHYRFEAFTKYCRFYFRENGCSLCPLNNHKDKNCYEAFGKRQHED